jgi:hypothetical protein
MKVLTNLEINKLLNEAVPAIYPFSAPAKTYALPTANWVLFKFSRYVRQYRTAHGTGSNPRWDCEKRANEVIHLAQLAWFAMANRGAEAQAIFAARLSNVNWDEQQHVVNVAVCGTKPRELIWFDSVNFDGEVYRASRIPPPASVLQYWG